MTTPSPDVVGQVVELHPEQIDASNRLLPLDKPWVEALTKIIKTDGQKAPVEVCRLPGQSHYTLVTGAHRHAVAKALGIDLRAIVVSSDAKDRRLREAMENVQRRDLAPLDRAKAIAEMVEVQKALAGIDPSKDGRAASIAARWQQRLDEDVRDTTDIVSVVYGFTDAAAERAGVTARTIRRDLELLRGISVEVGERLRRSDHPVFHNASQLRALAGLDPAEQTKAVSLLIHADAKIAGAPFDKATDAIAAMRGKEPPRPDAKRFNAFLGSFGRMPIAEKRGALAELAHHLPKGFRIVEGDAPAPAAVATFPADHVRYRDDTLETIDQLRELLDGLIEDEKLDDERHSVAGVLADKLQLARLTIAGNGFNMGDVK